MTDKKYFLEACLGAIPKQYNQNFSDRNQSNRQIQNQSNRQFNNQSNRQFNDQSNRQFIGQSNRQTQNQSNRQFQVQSNPRQFQCQSNQRQTNGQIKTSIIIGDNPIRQTPFYVQGVEDRIILVPTVKCINI